MRHSCTPFVAVWLTSLLLVGCKKPSTDCVLHIELQDAGEDVNQPPVEGIDASFHQQLLSGGILTSAFTLVDENTTNEQGICDLVFRKENALSYRLQLRGDQWFSQELTWNPDDFLPGDSVFFEALMMPRAALQIHLEAGWLAGSDDLLQFRTLHAPGEYPTCSDEWKSFDVTSGADTSWVCEMEGGATVAYAWKITRDGETMQYLDSIVAERFEQTTIHITW
jgi:hypothetical protein